jgi:transposase
MEKPQPPTIKKGASYPKEFREEAVRYWLSSGQQAKVVAAELGVSDWSLNRWRQEMEQAPASSAPEAGPVSPVNALELAKENGRLRRELEAMTRQRDILKKAISIFSAENHNGGLK